MLTYITENTITNIEMNVYIFLSDALIGCRIINNQKHPLDGIIHVFFIRKIQIFALSI